MKHHMFYVQGQPARQSSGVMYQKTGKQPIRCHKKKKIQCRAVKIQGSLPNVNSGETNEKPLLITKHTENQALLTKNQRDLCKGKLCFATLLKLVDKGNLVSIIYSSPFYSTTSSFAGDFVKSVLEHHMLGLNKNPLTKSQSK